MHSRHRSICDMKLERVIKGIIMRQNLLRLKKSIEAIFGYITKQDLLIFSNKNLSICMKEQIKRLVTLLITLRLVNNSSNQVSIFAKVFGLFCHGPNLEEYFMS